MSKLKTLGSAALLVAVVAGLLLGATGGAVGQTTGVTVANDTLSVDNDTRSVYADVQAGSNSSVELNVTFSGVDDSGNVTELETRTVSLNASEEQLVERTSVNATKYPEYRVMVTAPNTNSTNATAEVGKVQEVAGGSGGWTIGGQSVPKSVGIVAVVGVALLLKRRSD